MYLFLAYRKQDYHPIQRLQEWNFLWMDILPSPWNPFCIFHPRNHIQDLDYEEETANLFIFSPIWSPTNQPLRPNHGTLVGRWKRALKISLDLYSGDILLRGVVFCFVRGDGFQRGGSRCRKGWIMCLGCLRLVWLSSFCCELRAILGSRRKCIRWGLVSECWISIGCSVTRIRWILWGLVALNFISL